MSISMCATQHLSSTYTQERKKNYTSAKYHDPYTALEAGPHPQPIAAVYPWTVCPGGELYATAAEAFKKGTFQPWIESDCDLGIYLAECSP